MTAQHIQLQIIPAQGNTIGDASVLVVQHGLSIPSTLYTDATLTTTVANPVAVDSNGNIDFWVSDGSLVYDGFISGGYVKIQTLIADIANEASPLSIACYIPKYFQIDLIPSIGGSLGDMIVNVFYKNTSTNAPIFSDQQLTTPLANPYVLKDSYTVAFWAADGTVDYDIRITGNNLTGPVSIQDIWSLPGPIWADKSTFWQNEEAVWAWVNPYNVSVEKVQNVGQLYTANDLIRAAMRLIQVASVDTVLTASELQDGLESLNRMIDSWSLDSLMLYEVVREQFALTSGENPYTIGYGATWDTSRPLKIIDAYLVLNNGSIPVSYPMMVMNYDDYNAVRLKTLSTNFPAYLYYQPSFPIAEVYIYPIFAPNDPSTIGPAYINLTSWKPLDIIVDPTAYIELPPGYWEAIVFSLAVRIAEEYQFAIRPQTVALAESAVKRIKRLNTRTPTLQTDTALMNTSQMRYNIFSDSFGR